MVCVTMEYTNLGRLGTTVSQLCFGTWRFGAETEGQIETTREEAHELLDTAAELGINFIDTANTYGTPSGTAEAWLGEWLADRDREDFVVASKMGMNFDRDAPNGSGLSRTHIRNQIEGTLDRLGTDYLDLYYIHRWDDDTRPEEALSTLHGLVEEGKINYIGASTMAAWKLTRALWKADVNGWEPITVTQPPMDATLQNWQRYERFDLSNYLDVCRDQDLAVCPYSPLAGGLLTGKYERGDPSDPFAMESPDDSRGALKPWAFDRKYLSESAWAVVEAVGEIADGAGATPAQVALRWLIDQREYGAVVPVVGASRPEQLRENAAAVDLSLSGDQLGRIDEARAVDA